MAFAVFTATLDVYAGNQVQTLSPFREQRADVLAINVTTAVTWLSMPTRSSSWSPPSST